MYFSNGMHAVITVSRSHIIEPTIRGAHGGPCLTVSDRVDGTTRCLRYCTLLDRPATPTGDCIGWELDLYGFGPRGGLLYLAGIPKATAVRLIGPEHRTHIIHLQGVLVTPSTVTGRTDLDCLRRVEAHVT